jgi:hypothetical protein
MMRKLSIRGLNTANRQLEIQSLDERGAGGAYHLYEIRGFDTVTNKSDPFNDRYGKSADHATILFQNGPIDVDGNGVNGVTHEALLTILIDRLECFQAGTYACLENEAALLGLKAAQAALASRTAHRVLRGVEGTHTV